MFFDYTNLKHDTLSKLLSNIVISRNGIGLIRNLCWTQTVSIVVEDGISKFMVVKRVQVEYVFCPDFFSLQGKMIF